MLGAAYLGRAIFSMIVRFVGASMSLIQDVLAVQRLYPKLYVACHTTHGRSNAGTSSLTARECSVLSHLCIDPTLSAARLSKHLGVGRSTLSDVVGHLVEQSFLHSHQDPFDERKMRLTVTPGGMAAMSAISVLDGHRVGEVLARLTPRQRSKAIEGLTLLAEAAVPTPLQPTSTRDASRLTK